MRTSVKAGLLGVWLLNITLADAANGDWKQDWEKTVAAAEKEGEVTMYAQSRAAVGKALLAFKDAYPKININFVGGSGSDLAKKIMAEKGRASIWSILASAAVEPWCWSIIRPGICSRFRRC